MRPFLILAMATALSSTLPLFGESRPPAYKIEYDGNVEYRSYDEPDGRKGLFGTVRYKLTNPDGVPVSENDKIVILEDGKEVKRFPIRITKVKVRGENLTTVLALDVSASMGFNNKIGEAKNAAGVFLDELGNRMDTGLILFNHEVAVDDPNRFRKPSGKHSDYKAQTETIRGLINQAQPLGGSAYRDATAKALDMLAETKGTRAVVLMTDGVDVSSSIKLPEVIKKATTLGIPVYTVGVGAPGLSAVLVLDHSGSMAAPANDTDKKPKINALREAGNKFIDEMRSGSQATLIPFSTDITSPEAFTDKKAQLREKIDSLTAEGGTSLYDATLAGVETLVAANPPGNRVVVVLTDGKDESPGSRNSDQAVIDRAKEVGIKLYMLGLGRKKEINEAVMTRMARQTGGEYFYVGSAEELIRTFEKLSADLNDMEALKELAEKTGGKYYSVRDVSQLRFAFKEVAQEVLQLDESGFDTAEFKSARDVNDGTARKITIEVRTFERVDSTGESRSNVSEGHGNVRGLLVPAQSPMLYLALLVCVVVGLAIPPALRAFQGKRR